MRYRVIVVSGAGAGRRFELSSDEARVGRAADCEVVIDPAADVVSQYHGRLSVKGSRLVFEDTSTNGMFVHDRRVREIFVETGTVVLLGRSGPQIRFEILDVGRRVAPKTQVEVEGAGPHRSAPASGSYSPPAAEAYAPAPMAGAYALAPYVPSSPSGYGAMAPAVPMGVPVRRMPGDGVVALPHGYPLEYSTEHDARDRDQSQLKFLSIFYGILSILLAPTAVFGTMLALSISTASVRAGLMFGMGAVLLWLELLLDVLMAYALATHRWHTFCAVIAVISCLVFPLGTVLGGCCLMVLTRPSAQRLFAGSPAVPRWVAPYWPGQSRRT
jgi:Inner membrane component of T3SS, cytoplasmic domain